MPTRANAKAKYQVLLPLVRITEWGQKEAAKLAVVITNNKTRYQSIEQATGAPWQFVAALHHMECSGNFSQHLANGDPISEITTHEPAGIRAGTWEECAIAAIKLKSWDSQHSWDDWLTILYRAEAYNGFGYWTLQPSPYLWSGTTAYTTGKYVADGRYDRSAKSSQVGVYPILMALGLPALVNLDLNSQGSMMTTIDPNNKKAIQDHLIRIGLLDPPSDDKWGSLSQSAWRAWCRQYGDENAAGFGKEQLEALAKRVGYLDLQLKPKDPNDKENVVATLALKRMQELKMWLSVSMGSESPSWNFFYISGTNPDGTFNGDKIDYMNDLRVLAKIMHDGTVELGGMWVATWDAGWRYRKQRMNSGGCFQINYDQQFFAWVRGKHGTAAPHYALTQAGEIAGTRDDSEDGRTKDDKADSGSDFAVNHHGTPGRSPGSPIGPWSAGCGVGDNYDSHKKFMSIIDQDRRFKASSGHMVSCCFLKRDNIKGLPLVPGIQSLFSSVSH